MKNYIGCSGYHYDDLRGKFYDKDLPKKEWLSFYASKFNSLEINSSFYRLPEKKSCKKWYDATPEKFRFTVKGSQYITHSKKIKVDKDLKEGLQKLYNAASVFGDIRVSLEKNGIIRKINWKSFVKNSILPSKMYLSSVKNRGLMMKPWAF